MAKKAKIDYATLEQQIENYARLSTGKRAMMSPQSQRTLLLYMNKLFTSKKEFSRLGVMSFFGSELGHLTNGSKKTIMFTIARFLKVYGYISTEDYQVLTNLYKEEQRTWSNVTLTEADIVEIISYFEYRDMHQLGVFTFLSAVIGTRITQTLNLRLTDFQITPTQIAVDVVKQKHNMLTTTTNISTKRFNRTHKLIGKQMYSTDEYLVPHLEYALRNHSTGLLLEINGKPIQERRIQRHFNEISTRLGKEITPHSLRHYVGHKIAVEHGILAAATVLDHSDLRTTEKYINKKLIDTSVFI